ncbi:amidohydrolase family protein [Aquihabitans sp. G128]|uniref:N-acyl-D-amino-acid deacylase family protein n=1 Tax=Aquihabitans sp. G128 TaxID=2849779 RepID=UPI001C2381E0|nr:amidohydrolase family protein [Aquihabitans sp. G128]QXC59541.1 amidohydrolase family protein [Aquihabitans sp. G128]
MHDLLITGGLVVDGTGVPGRVADVAIADGKVVGIGRHRGEQAQRTIDATGLVVAPGIVDAHTHYDPQVTWDGLCDTSTLHGVTTVAAGNCGFGVAPCHADDREYLLQLFARVEGMDLDALGRIEAGFETFPEFLRSREGRLGVNFGMYVGHSAIRRWVMGDASFEREATADEVAAMVHLVDEALQAGALGFSSSLAPTHLDLADRPIPSRLASLDEVRALADAVGRYGRGSIAFAPESAVEGISPEDRDLLIELARRGGVPSITQGLGGRSKVDAPTKTWEESRRFLDRSADLGTPVYSLLMTRALNGPFTVAEGTSRYEGVPSWHRLMTASLDEKRRILADPAEREALRHGIDHPNLDPSQGTTLPPPFWESLRLSDTRVAEDQRWIGRAMADIAAERRVHPADALLDLAVADDLEAVFHWSNETPAWRELLRDVQRHPQMIVGVSDGGAHLDRDDGQEWSTHFLATWWRSEQVWRLEEAIRLMTAIPASILGLTDRGVLATGRAADVFLFDPERIDVGTCRREQDPVLGVPRFRGVPVGINATIVNGEVVVEDGQRMEARPGHVVRPS